MDIERLPQQIGSGGQFVRADDLNQVLFVRVRALIGQALSEGGGERIGYYVYQGSIEGAFTARRNNGPHRSDGALPCVSVIEQDCLSVINLGVTVEERGVDADSDDIGP